MYAGSLPLPNSKHIQDCAPDIHISPTCCEKSSRLLNKMALFEISHCRQLVELNIRKSSSGKNSESFTSLGILIMNQLSLSSIRSSPVIATGIFLVSLESFSQRAYPAEKNTLIILLVFVISECQIQL